MEKDEKNSPGAEGHKLTRFGSTGKATFQATNPPKLKSKTVTPDTITVADIYSMTRNSHEKVAQAMNMNFEQLFVKAVQNERRMAEEAGKLRPTYTVYTKDDIPRLIAATEPKVKEAVDGNTAAPECDGNTTGDNEQDASVHEDGAKQRGTTLDQPSIESTVEEKGNEV